MDRALKLVLDTAETLEPMKTLQNVANEHALRIVEAVLFAASEPLPAQRLSELLPPDTEVTIVLAELSERYATRGVNLVKVAGGYCFRTASDLAFLVSRETETPRKLGRAALEILAIIAYHQPVTRAEIEEIRGVTTSKGTLDFLLETGWVRMRGRRRTPGRPVTYGTTSEFLNQFNLDQISDLPGIEELKGAGLLDGKLPPGFNIPSPNDDNALTSDEDRLEDDIFDHMTTERLNTIEPDLDPI
jgi:segregation and condensation protein B